MYEKSSTKNNNNRLKFGSELFDYGFKKSRPRRSMKFSGSFIEAIAIIYFSVVRVNDESKSFQKAIYPGKSNIKYVHTI